MLVLLWAVAHMLLLSPSCILVMHVCVLLQAVGSVYFCSYIYVHIASRSLIAFCDRGVCLICLYIRACVRVYACVLQAVARGEVDLASAYAAMCIERRQETARLLP